MADFIPDANQSLACKGIQFLDHGQWKQMDTTLAQRLTDKQLLDQISMIPICVGWGLVAELMKRFSKRSPV